MADPLVPCPSCARHVRVAELACPFCAANLPRTELAPVSTQPLRVTRATLFAFGASLAVASCASPSPAPLYGAPAGDMSLEAGTDAVVLDVGTDGGPPADAGFDARADAARDAAVEASVDAGSDDASDANTDDTPDGDGSTAGPYGSPPWPDAF